MKIRDSRLNIENRLQIVTELLKRNHNGIFVGREKEESPPIIIWNEKSDIYSTYYLFSSLRSLMFRHAYKESCSNSNPLPEKKKEEEIKPLDLQNLDLQNLDLTETDLLLEEIKKSFYTYALAVLS